jgi:hypothetical protein
MPRGWQHQVPEDVSDHTAEQARGTSPRSGREPMRLNTSAARLSEKSR